MFKTRIALAVMAGALTLPAGASAGVVVEADRLLEGDAGLTRAPSNVRLSCNDRDEWTKRGWTVLDIPNRASCEFEVLFTEGTAQAFADYGFDPPRRVSLRTGQTADVAMRAEIVGDTTPELDETLRIKVVETKLYDGRPIRTTKRVFSGPTILNDDGPRPRDNIRTRRIGKAKAPVRARETMVGRWNWTDDTSTGANCVTDDAQGLKGAFGAWGYYIPGCVTATVVCPAGRRCIGHARSTITSSARARVTLNQRVRVSVGNGTPPWKRDGSCDSAGECTAQDDTILIHGGGSASLECNGVHAGKGAVANVECNLDLEYVE